MPVQENTRWQRALTMLSLVLAGETIFLPAFHLTRYFKSSALATYSIDEFQLGGLGAIYGVFATACYFLGGPLADRWSPRKLLSISLIMTGLGSIYMATFPSYTGLRFLFAYWGISTILVFWAPLIRATREWATADGQARAFGILDGGRGLASAAIASLAAFAFAKMVGGEVDIEPAAEANAVKVLVLSYAGYCAIAAVCVWMFVPEPKRLAGEAPRERSVERLSLPTRLAIVLRSPAIWLQAIIIIAAYSSFKMLDNYGLYAEDAYGFTKTESAQMMANVSYIRVAAALAAGWIADRLLGVRSTIQICFALLILANIIFLCVTPSRDLAWLMVTNVAVSCVGFFALRGIYFALLEDSRIPRQLTGTAVGIISFVGYAPEIYMGPLTGWLIRESRQEGNVLTGYRDIFFILTMLCACGVLAAFALRWFVGNQRGKKPISQ